MLTEEQKKNYLKSRGLRCPYCLSEDVTGISPLEADGDTASGRSECFACGKKWIDIYTLVGIEDYED
jgi:transcriptional regulator NrdR family protein